MANISFELDYLAQIMRDLYKITNPNKQFCYTHTPKTPKQKRILCQKVTK